MFFVETEKIGLKVLIIIKKAMPRGVQALKINETVNDNDETLKIAFLLTFFLVLVFPLPFPLHWRSVQYCSIETDFHFFY